MTGVSAKNNQNSYKENDLTYTLTFFLIFFPL